MLDKMNVVENVLRIQTDSVVFNKPIDFTKFDDYYPIKENKTTGYIKFKNLNDYVHICVKCGEEYKYKLGCENCNK